MSKEIYNLVIIIVSKFFSRPAILEEAVDQYNLTSAALQWYLLYLPLLCVEVSGLGVKVLDI